MKLAGCTCGACTVYRAPEAWCGGVRQEAAEMMRAARIARSQERAARKRGGKRKWKQ